MIMTVLLQVLDDGRLTDGQGRTVDFSNTVIILTSNLGSEYLLKASKDGRGISPETRALVMETVKRHFRPEFLNRLDDLVVFQPLSRSELDKIVLLQISNVQKRLEDRDIKLELNTDAITLILEEAYDPLYGARPLRRYLEKHIATQLSRLIISGELSRACVVKINASPQRKLSFTIVAK